MSDDFAIERATYYRGIAGALRDRAMSMPSNEHRDELCAVASDYERLAEFVESIPAAEPISD
jgi:hypothetical protein